MYYWLSLSSHCSLLWICQACYFHRCFRAWEPLIQMLCCFDTVPVLDGKTTAFWYFKLYAFDRVGLYGLVRSFIVVLDLECC